MRHRTSISSLLLTAALLTWAAPALAQAVPEPADETPADASPQPVAESDIVVTAQRRTQRLQDVPVAASVISGDMLLKQGIRDLPDLATRLPGLKIGSSTQSDYLSIRGIASGNSVGFEQAVGTFVDGVYRGRSRSSRAALFDIERVEVLKGPQSTFFGNNTIAGALNITSRKPGDTFDYNANALSSPTDGEYNLEAGVTVPITSTLSARAAGKFSGMDGYIRNEFLNEDSPHMRDFVGRVSLRWQPSDTFESNLRYDHARNRDHGQYTLELTDCPPPAPFTSRGSCALYLQQNGGSVDDELNYRAASGPSHFNLDLNEVAWTNELHFGDYSLTSVSSYFDQQAETYISAQPVPVAGVGNSSSRSPFLTNEDYKSYSQELRLQSPTGGFFEYMVGAYYMHGKLETHAYAGSYGSTVGSAGAPFTNANTPIVGVRNFEQREDTLSGFASATFNFTERLKLNLGARYTNVHKVATRSVQAGAGQFFPGPDYIRVPAAVEQRLINAIGFNGSEFADPDTRYKDFMPSGSLQYKISPDVTGYVSYSEGFLAGGYTDLQTPQQFLEESVKAYEVGVKGTLFNRTVTFNIDVFRSNYSDLQESFSYVSSIPPFLSVQEIRNVASARSEGVEFNANYRAADWLSFNTDVSYVDSKYTRYPGAACTQLQTLQQGGTCTQDLSGRPRILAPKFSGVIGATATLPVGDDHTLGISPQLYHSSSYYLHASLDEGLKQKAYEKVDVRVDFGPRDRHWEIAVLAKNLTNSISSTVGTFLGSAAGSNIRLPERARSFAIAFSVKR